MPRIPDHIIEQIRSQSNIVEIVGEHVQLKQTGRGYIGLCPFHKEKTPSFNVNVERGMYKCFGCGKGGNAITFVQEHNHMTFPDAVRHLATKMGITIPEEEVDDPTGMGARREAARSCLREVATFYQNYLGSSDGAPARHFFEHRGFSDEIIDEFGLGASPASWDATIQHLEHKGFSRQHLEDSGLIIVKDDGSVYDRFRGRAMFAIRDESGRIVGFSARTLSDEPGSPKYINSPQSIVFDKSRVLFGLDLAKRKISEHRTANLVEGQADVIAMHQAGFSATVASSGTALTADQLRILKRYADTIILIFDADEAGQKAMSKGIEIGLSVGLDIKCVALPKGEDPDSVLVSQGPDAMQTLVNSALNWLHYQTNRFRETGAFEDPVQQAKAIRTILTWIAGVPDKLRHPFLVRDVAQRFSLEEKTLLSELNRIKPLPPGVTISKPIQRQAPPTSQPFEPLPDKNVALIAGERELLRIVLTVEHGLALMLNHYNLDDSAFVSQRAKQLYRHIIIADQEHHDGVRELMQSDLLSEEDIDLMKQIISSTSVPSSQWKTFDVELPDPETARAVRDALVGIALHRVSVEIESLNAEMTAASTSDELKRVVFKLQKLVDRRENLKREYAKDPSDMTWLDENTASES